VRALRSLQVKPAGAWDGAREPALGTRAARAGASTGWAVPVRPASASGLVEARERYRTAVFPAAMGLAVGAPSAGSASAGRVAVEPKAHRVADAARAVATAAPPAAAAAAAEPGGVGEPVVAAAAQGAAGGRGTAVVPAVEVVVRPVAPAAAHGESVVASRDVVGPRDSAVGRPVAGDDSLLVAAECPALAVVGDGLAAAGNRVDGAAALRRVRSGNRPALARQGPGDIRPETVDHPAEPAAPDNPAGSGSLVGPADSDIRPDEAARRADHRRPRPVGTGRPPAARTAGN